jgi:hypothetical protein
LKELMPALSLVPRNKMNTAWTTAAHMASSSTGIMDNIIPKSTFYGNSVLSIANSQQKLSPNCGE